MSFFGSLSSLAGHELIHYPDILNKIVGNIPYTQVFYSHFWDEHIHSHHKNLATSDDPVCHDVGVDAYSGMFKGVVGTHMASWNREMAQLTKKYGQSLSIFMVLLDNKMVYY